MSSKSQHKKEQRARKQKQERKRQARFEARQQGLKRQAEFVVVGNARHRERVSRQIPVVWPGEIHEDVAVFDDSVLSTLPPDVAQQVTAVREALEEACESRGDDALKRVAEISRASPLSQWRLFIRGLIDWQSGAAGAASEAWQRLDPERRPGRIATAMMRAHGRLEYVKRLRAESLVSGDGEREQILADELRWLAPSRRQEKSSCVEAGSSGLDECAKSRLP